MKKIVLLISVVFLILSVGLLYGGKKEEPVKEPAEVEKVKEEAAPVKEEGPYGNWEGVTINCAILAGSQTVVYAKAAEDFNKLTGCNVVINDFPFNSLYDKQMTEAVSHSGAFDIISPAQFWVGDFVATGFPEPLDKYMKKWPLEDQDDIVDSYIDMGVWGGKTYTIVTDGDHFAVYYRRSWFEDQKEKDAFKQKYGYELAPPKTWEEFKQIAEFFTRDTDGDGNNDMWGTAFMASRGEVCFEFVQRFYSFGGEFFDTDTMAARINTEAGVNALKTLHEIMDYCPPGVLNMTFTENRDAFVGGKLAMVMNWPDFGGQSEKPEISKIVGDVGYSLVPGAMVDGKLNRNSLLAFGFCTMLSADSKNKEAAYQFMRYFSSKDVSTWVISQSMGLDAWRKSHFKNPKLLNAFPSAPAFYKNMHECMEMGVPDLRIPGAQKYYDIIGVRVGEALAKAKRGSIDYQAVVDAIAKEWDEYTNQLGKENQLKIYRSSIGFTD